MDDKLWRFTDNTGSFISGQAHRVKALYFPLCNERIMSSVTPDLHGDIKRDEHSFLLEPVSRIDLVNSRSSRNFWVYINKEKAWSATGVSKDLNRIQQDRFKLQAGLLWHKITRENKEIGLCAEILSFVPATNEPVEIMQITLTNISSRSISCIPTAAIPLYARGASNIRDHRHVTSLLQRITLHKFGVIAKSTLIFDEAGHRPNKTQYFVLGWDGRGTPPQYLYPTQEMFCGEEGDLEAPGSIIHNVRPKGNSLQGRDAMGGLRFSRLTLKPKASHTYIMVMGITDNPNEIKEIIPKFNSLEKVKQSLERTKQFWIEKSNRQRILTPDADFDNWFRWVSIQPTLRRIFGCSYLPDFDYGKGGRGWRDLWQDCLGLIVGHDSLARQLLIDNFRGVRIDGSNATIIGKKPGEFIADRNNITRVWMDHGVWPLLALDLYLGETQDFDILFEPATYFRDHRIFRSQAVDSTWDSSRGKKLRAISGKIYTGTIFEHALIQNLVQFFNVGSHNHVRLEGADWNDGLDMAKEHGESVAFSCMYAHNLKVLSELILKTGKKKITLLEEIKPLLTAKDYGSVSAKNRVLRGYFSQGATKVRGTKINVDSRWLAQNLKSKSGWMMQHIRKTEWLKEGFFNGYYDNKKRRVEGRLAGRLRMCLASQVFAIMSGVAEERQIKAIIKSVDRCLYDNKLGGFHLNTDFKEEQHALGRAFSFVYGDKENGAFFNHMAVMYAYALYKRGFTREGKRVFDSIYSMAVNSKVSKIYPCLPEYFDGKGRGKYSYLTGSASWFVLVALRESCGAESKKPLPLI